MLLPFPMRELHTFIVLTINAMLQKLRFFFFFYSSPFCTIAPTAYSSLGMWLFSIFHTVKNLSWLFKPRPSTLLSQLRHRWQTIPMCKIVQRPFVTTSCSLSPFSLWNSRLRHLAYLFSAFLNCFLGGLGSTIPKPLFLSLFPSILKNLQKLEYQCLITGVYLLKTSHIPSAINNQHLTVKCPMLRGMTEVQMLSTASAGSAASRLEQFPNMQP